MHIGWASNIAEKLFSKTESPQEFVGDQSARAAALDLKKKSAWKGLKQLPSGYGRSVRRARDRDIASQRRKQRRQTFRNTRERERFYDHAGQLARIYFGLIEVRPEVGARIAERVRSQARALSGREEISYRKALEKVEQSMRENLAQADQIAAQRLQRKQQSYLQSRRGTTAAKEAGVGIDRAVAALDRRGLEIS